MSRGTRSMNVEGSKGWLLWRHGLMTLRMYCIDAEALVFMFSGGSCYGFTTHHINDGKHMHDGFLAPPAYLCSTSLNRPPECIMTSPFPSRHTCMLVYEEKPF